MVRNNPFRRTYNPATYGRRTANASRRRIYAMRTGRLPSALRTYRPYPTSPTGYGNIRRRNVAAAVLQRAFRRRAARRTATRALATRLPPGLPRRIMRYV